MRFDVPTANAERSIETNQSVSYENVPMLFGTLLI